MKHLATLFAGVVVGIGLFAIGLFLNPFAGQQSVSPLSVSDDRLINLSFSAVPGEAILYTDHGDSNVATIPERVPELWEPAIEDTSVFVTQLNSARGEIAGFGVKMRTLSEQTAVLDSKALTNSVWHVYMPGRGTLMVDQSENHWSYLRDVVIPAHWSSGDYWRGTFHGIMTNGPGSLGTGRVTGGSGIFAGLETESVESLTANGYSSETGPVAADGRLTIALPQAVARED